MNTNEPAFSNAKLSSVEIEGIVKRFGSNEVLHGVTLSLHMGTIHGFVGANGAGKSTLIRILVGELGADAGRIRIGSTDMQMAFYDVNKATSMGLRIVHQEMLLFTNLTVGEHFALDRGLKGSGWRETARRLAHESLKAVFPSSKIDPGATIDSLPLYERQMIEVARAATAPNLRLLVLDEPTSALPRDHTNELGAYLRALRDRGVTSLFVTHRLQEILEITDIVTVLGDGQVQGSFATAELTKDSLVRLMGGETNPDSLGVKPVDRVASERDARVSIDHYSNKALKDVSLVVDRGEVVGISGLADSGQQDLLHVLYKFRGSNQASIRVPRRTAYVSGDRHGTGLFLRWSIGRNITYSVLGQRAEFAYINPKTESAIVSQWRERLSLKMSSPDQQPLSLSGGNQQKILIARALAMKPDLLILEDPTRGVDASTKREVYNFIKEAAAAGTSVIWYSTEDEEMLQCSRVYVTSEGAIVRELSGNDLRLDQLVSAAFQIAKEDQTRVEVSRHWMPWKFPWFFAAVGLLCLMVLTAVTNPYALAPSGFPTLVSSFLPLVFAALAELFIILQSDIDLGLGNFIGLVNVISATWLVHRPLFGVLAIVGCLVLYVAQALVVQLRNVPAIIVTLGASFVWIGVALMIQPTPGGSSPTWLNSLFSINVPVVSEPLLLSIIFAVLGTLFLFRTRLGVGTRASGNNGKALDFLGRSSLKMKLTSYLLAGIMAVLAGLATTALTTASDAAASGPDTLLGIAMVIIGGGVFVGGYVNVLGAIIAAWMFGMLQAIFGLLNVNVNYTYFLEGMVLLLILAVRTGLERRSQNT